jgi:hypothetical protein
MVPWFDPDDAGVNARGLPLFEAPGRKATGESRPAQKSVVPDS